MSTPQTGVAVSDPPAAQAGSSPQARRPARQGRVAQLLEAYALLLLLVAVAVFFSVYPDTAETFPTAANIKILVASQAVIGVIALGALMPLLCQEFDLSVGAVAGLSAVLVADLLSGGTPLVAGILVGIGVGLVVGAVNAVLVTRAGVSGVIATLGVSTILTGVVLQITGGLAAASDIPDALSTFGTGTILGIPTVFVTLIVIAGIAYYLLSHTPFGRQMYALGSNPAAAHLVGVRTNLVRGLAFVLGSTLCGVAGVLYIARAGGADPDLGVTFTLPALAAAFLSAAAVKPGRFNVWGTLVAIFFLAVLNNGLNLAGAEPYVSDYVNGAALIVGVALAAFLHRRRTV